MGIMESSESLVMEAPLLLRNLLAAIFVHADKLLFYLSQKYKLLETIRYLLFSCFVFVLRILPSFFVLPSKSNHPATFISLKPARNDTCAVPCGGDSGIARALTQLLEIMNELPVSSRKYEVVRSLAERIIEENQKEGVHALREVNRTVLSAAFARSLSQLEAGFLERDDGGVLRDGLGENRLGRVLKAVRSVAEVGLRMRRRGRGEANCFGVSAEKLAAELLWLTQKLTACGCGEEAAARWAAADNLGWLALSAEPRLQGCLVKVAACLFKEAQDMAIDEVEEGKIEQHRQTKIRMLQSWLPLLCSASNGTDTPVLSLRERAELEKVLEDSIEELEQQEEQEKVLSIWLHHFTRCQSSDWPNLNACYTRWCNASRKQLLLTID